MHLKIWIESVAERRNLAKPVGLSSASHGFWVAWKEFIYHMFALSHLLVNCYFSLWNPRFLPPEWHVSLHWTMCLRVSHSSWNPYMYICNKVGNFLILICLILIWLLVHPEEFWKLGEKLFFWSHRYFSKIGIFIPPVLSQTSG